MNKKYNITITMLIVIALILSIIICSFFIKIDKVNPSNYDISIDYGNMTDLEIATFRDILYAVKNNIDKVYYINEIDHYSVLTHLGLYYGSMEEINNLCKWTSTEILLNLELFHKLEYNKIIIDSRIEEALTHIIEGSERFKIWQISNYISDKMTYTENIRETIDGLNGNGVCATYSMIFYKMVTRLGIQTYIVYGYPDGNQYHSWNIVEIDNNLYHYDITTYDTDSLIPNYMYFHSVSGWNCEYQINNIWWNIK